MEVWRAEDGCYYVKAGLSGHWYEVYEGVAVAIQPEDGLAPDEYMKYVLADAKRVQWNDAPAWVRNATLREE